MKYPNGVARRLRRLHGVHLEMQLVVLDCSTDDEDDCFDVLAVAVEQKQCHGCILGCNMRTVRLLERLIPRGGEGVAIDDGHFCVCCYPVCQVAGPSTRCSREVALSALLR